MSEVTYDSATCIYPGAERPAVDALQLAIKDGEFVVMVGPSGCGKTTALRMLAGLEEIDDGSIRIDGKDMVGVPSRNRDIAMVFQNYALYPSKTVGENMGFALKMQGVAKDERARRVREAASCSTWSRSWTASRVICPAGSASGWPWAAPSSASPRSSAWTSPCPTWTPSCGCSTRTQIAELQRRLQVTTVYVTHDQVEAMTMGDRVAVMRAGQLQQFAAPTELYDRPANVFVAGFIGSPAMNRFDATADSNGIHLGLATLRPSDAQLRAAQGHDKLIIGVRPEHLSVGDGELTVKVALVEDLGSDSFIYGRLADDESSSVIVRSGRDHPRHGDTVKVGVDTTHLHIFDAETGLRLGE